MEQKLTDRKITWLVAGTVLGMTIAYYCPAEPAYASTAMASEKFSMCTARTLVGNSDAVFVLDNVTGRLLGAAYSTQSGTFNQFYARNLALDFNVVENAQYLMVSGDANLKSGSGGPPASSAIYVGELNSGIVAMYGFPYSQTSRGAKLELVPITTFPWRQAVN